MLSEGGLVEYRPSDAWPLVFTAPHGGNLCPEQVPNRTEGCMETDWQSYELVDELLKAFGEGVEGPPALIALRLVRQKLDANRPRGPASKGSGEHAAQAWDAYHRSIEEALHRCVERFGFCLLLDIHGQSHRKGVTELGYLVTVEDLALSDEELGVAPRPSSIDSFLPPQPKPICSCTGRRSLQAGARQDLTALIRGPNSLGGLLGACGFPCTPSPQFPSPGDVQSVPYFHGGYTARRYGACGTVPRSGNPLSKEAQKSWGTAVAAVQMETSWAGVREHDVAKRQFAKALRSSVETFLKTWKGWAPALRSCQ